MVSIKNANFTGNLYITMYMLVLQEHVPCTVLKDVLDSQAAIERQQREAAEQLAEIRVLVASIKNSSRDVSSGSTSATNNTESSSGWVERPQRSSTPDISFAAIDTLEYDDESSGFDAPSSAPTTPSNNPVARSPRERILGDPTWLDMPIERAATGIACQLAEIYFGLPVLRVSNLTGRDGRSALDTTVMNRIASDIRSHFGQQISSPSDFRVLWKRCRDAIGGKCRHLRHKRYWYVNILWQVKLDDFLTVWTIHLRMLMNLDTLIPRYNERHWISLCFD